MERIALLFPGQGSYYIGMGKNLCAAHEAARLVFEEASETLGRDMKEQCFNGNLVELMELENMQPAILTASVAAYRVYMKEIGIVPCLSAGHSLGEYSALVCSGAVDFAAALKIVRYKCIISKEIPGAMTVINDMGKDIVEKECRKARLEGRAVFVSGGNTSSQVLVSGDSEDVASLEDTLAEMGAQIIPLMGEIPGHSPLMRPAAAKLKEELEKYSYSELSFPVISNVHALPYEGPGAVVENLFLQMISPVKWDAAMDYLKSDNITALVELGPKTVLRDLSRLVLKGVKAYSYDKEEDVNTLIAMPGTKGCRPGKDRKGSLVFIGRCLAAAVCTKNNNPNEDEYKKGVVEPYREMKRIYLEYERRHAEPENEQMIKALRMLHSVFITKKVPVEKQVKRIRRILAETGLEHMFANLEADFIDGKHFDLNLYRRGEAKWRKPEKK